MSNELAGEPTGEFTLKTEKLQHPLAEGADWLFTSEPDAPIGLFLVVGAITVLVSWLPFETSNAQNLLLGAVISVTLFVASMWALGNIIQTEETEMRSNEAV